uniref:Reticulon 1 n=1 Tax=Laticauda laticaudata TaxID=8630 RepID=A0A8C5SGD6_LATLA
MTSSRFYDYGSSKTSDRSNGSLYTSLLSDELYTAPQDSSYFTGNLSMEDNHITPSESTEGIHAQGGLFSSDSGIEMTPAEPTDVNKILADPVEQMKSESYKYMDISRSEEIKYQESCDTVKEDMIPLSLINKGAEDKFGAKGISLEEKHVSKEGSSFLLDHQYSPSETSQVKITLTEIETMEVPVSKEKTPEKQEVGLKPSHEIVPTVTVSEPEDDSPGSITPPSSGTEPSGSESQGKGSLSEDELINAIKEAKGFPFKHPEGQGPQTVVPEKQDKKNKLTEFPAGSAPLDNEASSAESGDSEIELVSEDPLAAEEVLHSNYMTFSHAGGPPPSPASPSIQYSILREEREAELDSELIIESCDASSASEESPKREHDSPLMKPIIMDIIQEENHTRNEGIRASDYNLSGSKESRMNRENLADSASYLKCSFAASKVHADTVSSPISSEEIKDKVARKKSVEMAVTATGKKSPSKDSLTKSPWSSPPLPFLNKQKGNAVHYLPKIWAFDLGHRTSGLHTPNWIPLLRGSSLQITSYENLLFLVKQPPCCLYLFIFLFI